MLKRLFKTIAVAAVTYIGSFIVGFIVGVTLELAI